MNQELPDGAYEVDEAFVKELHMFEQILAMSQAINFLIQNPSAIENMKNEPPFNQPELQRVDWKNVIGFEFTETGLALQMR